MKIGIDARTILNPKKCDQVGAGHYTYQLIRHLLTIDQKNEYVLFFDFRVREKDVKKFARPNVKIVFYPFSDYKKYLPGAYNELLGTAILAKEGLDVLHATSAKDRIPVGYRGRMIVTVNDLRAFVLPDSLPRMRRSRDRTVISYMAKKAAHVIPASAAVQETLATACGIPAHKMSVIHGGVDQRFFTVPDTTTAVPRRFGITKPYILFLGTLDPSKNVTRLLHAFALFKEKEVARTGQCDYQLVLAGKRGWRAPSYDAIIADLGLAEDVVFPGYVVGDDLVPLFREAAFFVLPSLWEGFGTTLLEAFATQTPAIVSRVGSFPEIAGNAARFVDPLDVQDITAALTTLASDEDLRNTYRDRGLRRAQDFDWRTTAEQTLALYEAVVKA